VFLGVSDCPLRKLRGVDSKRQGRSQGGVPSPSPRKLSALAGFGTVGLTDLLAQWAFVD